MSLVSLKAPQDLVLEGTISLSRLMEYRRLVDELLPADRTFTVDLSQLTAEDSSILALLVYLVRQSKTTGGQVTFTGVSDHLRDMAHLSGLAALIQLDTVEA